MKPPVSSPTVEDEFEIRRIERVLYVYNCEMDCARVHRDTSLKEVDVVVGSSRSRFSLWGGRTKPISVR